jgi:hypothetical protein
MRYPPGIYRYLIVDKDAHTLEKIDYNTDLKEVLKIVGDWVHAYDWYISGDTGQDTYLKEKQQAINRLKKAVGNTSGVSPLRRSE